jgi:hypothetical protein
MRKQKAHTLPIMRPPNRLRQRRTNIHNPQQPTPLYLITQRHRIRDHHSTQPAPIQCFNRISTQDSMGDDCHDFARFVHHYRFGGFDERAAGVGHVVDKDGDFVLDVADEHHAGDFIGARALFVDKGEAEVEAVGDGGCSKGWSVLVLN